jgi:Flp pilus assembly pilin Flp
MRNVVKAFAKSEDGAVTVDWVVLTALIVGIQIAVLLTPMRNSLIGVSENIADQAEQYEEYLEE